MKIYIGSQNINSFYALIHNSIIDEFLIKERLSQCSNCMHIIKTNEDISFYLYNLYSGIDLIVYSNKNVKTIDVKSVFIKENVISIQLYKDNQYYAFIYNNYVYLIDKQEIIKNKQALIYGQNQLMPLYLNLNQLNSFKLNRYKLNDKQKKLYNDALNIKMHKGKQFNEEFKYNIFKSNKEIEEKINLLLEKSGLNALLNNYGVSNIQFKVINN